MLEPEDETAYHYALLASREKQEAVVKKLKESRMKKKEELGATKKIAKIPAKQKQSRTSSNTLLSLKQHTVCCTHQHRQSI